MEVGWLMAASKHGGDWHGGVQKRVVAGVGGALGVGQTVSCPRGRRGAVRGHAREPADGEGPRTSLAHCHGVFAFVPWGAVIELSSMGQEEEEEEEEEQQQE